MKRGLDETALPRMKLAFAGEQPIAQQHAGECADCNLSRRVTRRCAFENRTQIVVIELHHARVVGVARARDGDGSNRTLFAVVERLDLHLLGPVGPVAVAYDHRDRIAHGFAEAYAG